MQKRRALRLLTGMAVMAALVGLVGLESSAGGQDRDELLDDFAGKTVKDSRHGRALLRARESRVPRRRRG